MAYVHRVAFGYGSSVIGVPKGAKFLSLQVVAEVISDIKFVDGSSHLCEPRHRTTYAPVAWFLVEDEGAVMVNFNLVIVQDRIPVPDFVGISKANYLGTLVVPCDTIAHHVFGKEAV